MWKEYISVSSINEGLRILAERGRSARIVAGATDLMLELERGLHPGIETLVDISRIPDLDRITLDDKNMLHLGPLVTHNHCASSKLLRERAYPLARAAWEVGAPQIRNRGTVAGNIITASPANDTITPLMALGAWVVLRSRDEAKNAWKERKVPLPEFYTGVRRTVLQPTEMMVDIAFPAMKENERGAFLKLALRRAQAISVVNVAIILSFDSIRNSKPSRRPIQSASITIGAAAPTIIHSPEAESYLVGKKLNAKVIARAAELSAKSSRPIDDIRGSAVYRREMVRLLTLRGLDALVHNKEQAGFPAEPVLLVGKKAHVPPQMPGMTSHGSGTVIRTMINGNQYNFSTGQDKNLLRLLREEAGLTGTKEGCAEGECGACTIYLDGKAVMACLVPAPRAHGAEIITIEGLADLTLRQAQGGTSISSRECEGGVLHPVQQAFIENGAVQCGYCTPGFLMSAAMLLEEKPSPARSEIAQAITGNLCRCTGYYKIVTAIEKASKGGG